MYFDNIKKLQLSDLIETKKPIYAHLDKDKEDNNRETLQQHMELVDKYMLEIIKNKKLDNIFNNFECIFIDNFSDEGKMLYREIIYNVVYMHDIGKINCNFQYRKMNNEEFENAKGLQVNNSRHSMLSAVIYLNHHLEKIIKYNNKQEKNILIMFALINSYIISKHHGGLDSFEEFENKMLDDDGDGKKLYIDNLDLFNEIYNKKILFNKKNKALEKIFNNVKEKLKSYEKNNKNISICFYIYERFLSSILLSCDYYATYEFKNGKQVYDFGGIDDIHSIFKIFKNAKIYKGIMKYKNEKYGYKQDLTKIEDINILRNEMFLDAEKCLLHNTEKNIFFLEAPTGSGKSNVSINLSFKLIEQCNSINKIFYVYPFNTLIEQNIRTINKIFKDNDEIMNNIAVINSVVPIKTEKKYEDSEDSDVINYEQELLRKQFLHYTIVLTTHVSIFNYLFGTSKDDLFPLYQIANSVIILDEIQSYKNYIWKEIITFLKYYSEILNIKIIIMSATLPDLSKLINKDKDFEIVNLIKNRNKYFSNSLFKDRVQLDFSLLEEKEDIENILFEHVIKTAQNSDKKILIEFITKKSAKRFFDRLVQYYEGSRQVELITGDDNSIERNEIINKIEENKGIILVATQVIEAGVDIDMDIGYKDISMLDLEEQFLGRINRSCKKKGKVFFFDLDNASIIYKNDVRKEKNINLKSGEKIRKILKEKNFEKFYDYVLRNLNEQANKQNDKNFVKFIEEKINKLNFKAVEERMKLIDESYEYTIFLNREIKLENGEILSGEKVWNEYIELLKNYDLPYAEKKIKLSQVTSKLNYFIYKVRKNDFNYNDTVGEIYYIQDGNKYFKNGKFNRESFEKRVVDFI